METRVDVACANLARGTGLKVLTSAAPRSHRQLTNSRQRALPQGTKTPADRVIFVLCVFWVSLCILCPALQPFRPLTFNQAFQQIALHGVVITDCLWYTVGIDETPLDCTDKGESGVPARSIR